MTGAAGYRIKGWHVFAALTAFFATIIALDAFFVTLAYRSFPGQSSANPYEAGLAYNATLAQLRREQVLGWSVESNIDAGGVLVRIHDRRGAPLNGLSVVGSLTRPATEAGAGDLQFRPVGPGAYRSSRSVPHGGWDLAVTARDGQGRMVNAERRILWR